ncbi:amidase family protein [Oleiharenicola lentus]|uniref:amidase family protein n=1 Tax=Oleiharenicola lentus TaxID=2508720 RepID=UPI003F66597C
MRSFRNLLPWFLIGAIVSAPLLRAKTTFDLTSASIADINAAFDANALTSERLTELFLKRIDAYDKKGPMLRAVIALNPQALDDARALDAERKSKGPRGPLHGIPVLIKDNTDVVGMPTTAGFYVLRDNVATTDAEQTRRLRAAGCVIVGKTNLSEFASGRAISTLGGEMHNPHATDRSPAGSSGGSGAGIAAGFAVFALGTDTGGSIRGPSAANGIAGLKPTFGLNGRGGIIPLSLSLDTVGPMARHVRDLAVALNVMAGVDVRDPATTGVSRPAVDYTSGLRRDALKGTRLGLLRDYMKRDDGVDAVIETVVAVLKAQGAEVVEITLPKYVIGVNAGLYQAIRNPEFRYQIEAYLGSLSHEGYPKTHAQIIELSEKIKDGNTDGFFRNQNRLDSYGREAKAGTLEDTPYLSALRDGAKIVRENLEWFLKTEKLDAFIVPTSSTPARLIKDEQGPPVETPNGSPGHLANVTGWPDLIVPAGFTSNPKLPVALSFIGPAFSEAKLLALGYAFEQALPVRALPVTTPRLDGEKFEY